jgi:hypothetical protein
MKLPDSLYFLKPGWWVLHLVSVSAVFGAGFAFSQHLTHAHGWPTTPHAASPHGHLTHDAPTPLDAPTVHNSHDAHAAHAAHEDHTSPQVLRPLMRQLLSDTIQLQGALRGGDLTRAATHADAIAGSCDDGAGAPQGALPAQLGPSFVEHDRALHTHAQQLGVALRAGQHVEARRINQEMVSACQSCHAQSPAAKNVDISALTFFADSAQK